MRLVVATALIAVVAAPAAADRLDVRVVEVAGGLAFVDQGRSAGIVRGTKIRFGNRTLSVVETTEKTAAVELGTSTLAVGATGIADVTPGAATEVRRLPAPRPPEAFVGQWPDPALPASEQTPRSVPLGSGAPEGRMHLAVIGRMYGTADRTGAVGQAEARVIASYDLLDTRPLSIDGDVALRAFTAGADAGARIPVFVRAAQLRYGADRHDPRFALGRLRYAASSLGMLDGARAAARLGQVELSAFGGVLPDPVNGKPDTSASRFGGEVVYDAAASAWRPRIAMTAYGSTWNGTLDERRLTATGSATRGNVHVDGWAEGQQFASSNPWGARSLELTGAGGTAQWRARGQHVGADVTFLRPERSLRLAAALPAEWLCTRSPQPGDVATEACTGGDSWISGSASAGLRRGRWSVDALGAVGRTNGVVIAYDTSGYLAGEVRIGTTRVLAGASGGRASFARWIAGHAGVGLALSRTLDVSARYRPELLDYVAATGPMLLHAAVLDAHVRVGPALDVAVSANGTLGQDRDALALLTTIAWRPMP